MSRSLKRRAARAKKAVPPYFPLDHSACEIRLINIMRLTEDQSEDAPIRCRMYTCRLQRDRPTYAALSYVWGNPGDTVEAQINGHTLRIPRNLSNFLKVLRTPYTISKGDDEYCRPPIWAGAICIDQGNVSERNHQVALMQTIYRLASQVGVWLGHPTEDPLTFLKQSQAWEPETFSHSVTASFWNGGCYSKYDSSCERSLKNVTSPADSHGLRELLDSAWWTRLWVIQEVALCSNAIAFWGPNVFYFNRLQRWLHHVVVHLLQAKDLHKGAPSSDPQFTMEYLTKKRRALEIVRYGLRKELPNLSTHEMLDCLGTVSERQTLEPRDRIYGILSLFPHNLNVEPNYASSLSEVFQAGTLGLMGFMKSPALIMVAGLQSRTELELPSWVPDFRAMQDFPLLGGHADGQRSLPEKSVCFHGMGERLTVQAVVIDQVTWATSCIPHVSAEDLMDQSHSTQIKSSVWECIKVLVASQHRRNAFEEVVEAFCSAVLAGRRQIWESLTRDEQHCLNQYDAHGDLVHLLQEWMSPAQDRETSKHLTDAALMRKLAEGLLQQYLFITKRGRIGRVPLVSPRKGDLIAIVAKVPLPVIIRPRPEHGSNVYELVRTCLYCHGVMYGEAVREAALNKNGDDTNVEGVYQEIVLV